MSLRAFGLSLLADMPLPGAWEDASEQSPPTEPILRMRSATPQAIAERWSGMETVGWEGVIDGSRFVVERGLAGDHRFVHVERGLAGDHRFVHAERSVHHLSADASLLLCGPDEQGEPLRWRVILDSVLFTVALLRGYEALHAGAVATEGGAIAITAGTGGGKSTLLVELLRGGGSLLADDVVVLESRGEVPPLAHPGAPLMTVPASTSPLPGDLIAPVGEERWIAVAAHQEAIPLRELVVLNRAPGLATSLHPARDPLAVLIGSLLRFPRTPERERTRFEMAGAIAAHVPIWELSADPSVTPGTLAGMLRGLSFGPGASPESPATVA